VSTAHDPLQLELERAQTLVELRRYEEASAFLTQLLAREPEVASAWCLLAQSQLAARDPETALDAAERAAALEPENEWPHRLRSAALQNLGRPGSIAAAREAVAAAPHAWQTHLRLAEALAAAKTNPDAALAAAERAVALAPNEPNTYAALGRAYEMRGDHAEAERSFRQALALDPQHAGAHHELARRRYEASGGRRRRFGAGNLAAAASGFRDAVEANPRSHVGAANVEIVIRSFLARLSYLIFVSVWLATFVANNSSSRVVPALLIAIPMAFAVRFLIALAPDLRRRVGYMAFHGWLAPASCAQVVAIALMLVSAAGPSGARIGFAAAAFLISLAGRIYLIALRRRRLR
jgi:tetratricopeptide (TPR) repeat protein